MTGIVATAYGDTADRPGNQHRDAHCRQRCNESGHRACIALLHMNVACKGIRPSYTRRLTDHTPPVGGFPGRAVASARDPPGPVGMPPGATTRAFEMDSSRRCSSV